MARSIPSLLVLLLANGCAGRPIESMTQGQPSSAPVAEKAPMREEPISTSTLAAELASTPPQPPDSCTPPAIPKPNGIIAADVLDDMGKFVPGMDWDRDFVGFNAALGQGVEIRDHEPHGANCSASAVEVFLLGNERIVSRKEVQGDSCDSRLAAQKQIEEELLSRGFAPVKNLIARANFTLYADMGIPTVVALDAPLCGWMVTIRTHHGRHEVSLVSPANDRSYALGSTPVRGSECIFHTERGCAQRRAYVDSGLTRVALTPDRARLYVAIAASSGAHHSHAQFLRRVFALPPAVVPTP